jgi:diaminopimelate epimerase
VGPATTPGHDATMLVINYDGSRPEMCGNGLRTVALVVATDLGRDHVVIDTDAGPRACDVQGAAGPVAVGLAGQVTVDMGPGRDLGPVSVPAFARPFTRVSMGNPHAIVLCAAGEDPEHLARTVGPKVERDPAFPAGTNVEFYAVDRDGLRLWVFERGVGITEACGTGACATAFAAAHAGHVPFDAPVAVHLPGGTLKITVPATPDAGLAMRGPARVVFRGSVD